MRSIPYITHQIWFQGWNELPPKFEENVVSLRSLNRHYEHKTWDEASLLNECALLGPEYVAKFQSFPHMMQKIDFGRYIVLYNHGGISVDTDMKSLAPIDTTPHIEEADFLVSYAAFPMNILGQTNNALFIVKEQHPIMKQIIDGILANNMKEEECMNKEMFTNETTGPKYIHSILEQNKDSIQFLDHTFYEPCFSVDPYCKPASYSIMDHKHELSWINNLWKYIFRVIFYIIYNPLILFLIALSIVYGFVCRNKKMCLWNVK